MQQAHGDLWSFPAQVRCITTNGDVNRNGQAVMGRGCALEAKQRYPGLDVRFGSLLKRHGNRVMRITDTLWSFPVKHHWLEQADLDLIELSGQQLYAMVEKFEVRSVVLPRPGCGNGQRTWDEVEPVLRGLDDRFTVITF